MSKIKVASDAPLKLPLHTHLEQVVDYLIANGNVLSKNYRWGSNREGYFCYFKHPIDFDGLQRSFDFPPTIVLGKERNVIYCQNTGCLIQTESNIKK